MRLWQVHVCLRKLMLEMRFLVEYVVSFDGDTFYATLIAWNYCHLKIVSHLIDAILHWVSRVQKLIIQIQGGDHCEDDQNWV